MERDIMLFAGGVSFFGLLALFPGAVLATTIYGMVADPDQVEQQLAVLTGIMPEPVQDIVAVELTTLASASSSALSLRGLAAVLITLVASLRGAKAIIAGLNRVIDDKDVRGPLRFNLFAAMVTAGILGLLFLLSLTLLTIPVLIGKLPIELPGWANWATDQRLWTAGVFALGLALLYQFATASRHVPWAAVWIGAGTASLIWMLVTWAFGAFVIDAANYGATYGSVATVVIFLVWVYITSYAIFFGAALTMEAEQRFKRRPVPGL